MCVIIILTTSTIFYLRSEGLYNTIDELKLQQPMPMRAPSNPIPFSVRSSVASGTSEFSNPQPFSGKGVGTENAFFYTVVSLLFTLSSSLLPFLFTLSFSLFL